MADFIILHEENVPGVKLLKDPSSCNMEELKRWPRFKKSGKKEILIEKVRQKHLQNKSRSKGRRWKMGQLEIVY